MPTLRSVLGQRLLLADGGIGTMLQRLDLPPAAFGGYEGCNEILNVTRPEAVAGVHQAYVAAGADLLTTNTFGANATVLDDYGLTHRAAELAEAGARLARSVADGAGRPCWVMGSIGPGTKLASLGQVSYAELKASAARQTAAMAAGGVDAITIETAQDLLGIRATVAGVRQGLAGVDLPVFVSVTLEPSGTLLVGSDLGAVVATLEPLGIDALGLNCATGPDQMSGPLRTLAGLTGLPLTCRPNAGLPVLTAAGATYPLSPDGFAEAMTGFARAYGLAVAGGCCGTTDAHIAALRAAVTEAHRAAPATRETHRTPGGQVASLYSATDLRQDVSYLSIGERTNAAGSRAFREAVQGADWDAAVAVAREQVAEGAHVLDLCVDYVGRDGRADLAELVPRLTREVDVPLQLDTADPAVLQAGLELNPGRAIVNSVNLEGGTGPGSKFARSLALVKEHGAAVVGLCIDESGQARTAAAKVAVARRLIEVLTREYGLALDDIIIDALTYPITTGQAEGARDAAETITAIGELRREFPAVHLTAGVSNVSFGLKPAARVVLNSVYLDQCRQAGLDAAIVAVAKIRPLASLPPEQVAAALDLIWDRRVGDQTPLDRYLGLFESVRTEVRTTATAQPLPERLRAHILDGAPTGLEADLTEALQTRTALDLINTELLGAMREVGERFGAGTMQLPFVLKSAEVMKRAVGFLEPHLDRGSTARRGTLVLATVRGDVHDIGKNLVDIILSNNGYTVVNLGIKQPIGDIIAAAEAHEADAIGLSGLLVKSTVVMAEDLAEITARGLAPKYPVLVGGAALTRAYVETDLAGVYAGEVRYARDAFEGLALMDAVMAAKTGAGTLPAPRAHTVPRASLVPAAAPGQLARPVPGGVDVPVPPFWGTRAGGTTVAEVLPWLDRRALFAGQWGLTAGPDGPTHADLVETTGEPRLAYWLERAADWFDCRVVWGYWPCHSAGDVLIVHTPGGAERFTFPRQSHGQRLCLADYFRTEDEAAEFGPDVVAFQLVTVGETIGSHIAGLFAADAYRDYFELHGLSVQMTEALAEFWHDRIRVELGLTPLTTDITEMVTHQRYQGERFSFGYPACPDLAQRAGLVRLLHPEQIGVTLSDTHQLHPEQSTDALIVHHPAAHLFSARSHD